jgi:6-phosphogluconate dehydrogenase
MAEDKGTYDVGVIGLAVMGSNLALNIADKGFKVAVFNRTFKTTQEFVKKNEAYKNLDGFETMADFTAALKKPRRALILVKAGGPTDATIKQLMEHFEEGDIIVDTGNAHFRDQTRRAEELEAKGLRFLGMGISGGEEGARKGPAFFPGGTPSVWNDIKDVIEAASAKAEDGRPCAVMNGKGGAGSCVKMYHNAGEYAILQIWGEVFAIMRQWRLSSAVMTETLTAWKTKKGGKHNNFLASYMLDITAEVVKIGDSPEAGGKADGSPLIERTMDMVGSKGTGLWSVQEALGAGVPAPSLAEAVLSRQMSMYRSERLENAKSIVLPTPEPNDFQPEDLEDLYWAAGLAIIASYAQMFQCLRVLDKEFEFGLHLPSTIATFRAGCILQGYLLTPMTKAFEDNPDLPSLLCAFAEEIQENLPRYRRVVAKILSESNTPVPVMMASLSYIETMCSTELAAGQCVALQRDVFGRHGFKRLDKEGDFNAKWPELQ